MKHNTTTGICGWRNMLIICWTSRREWATKLDLSICFTIPLAVLFGRIFGLSVYLALVARVTGAASLCKLARCLLNMELQLASFVPLEGDSISWGAFSFYGWHFLWIFFIKTVSKKNQILYSCRRRDEEVKWSFWYFAKNGSLIRALNFPPMRSDIGFEDFFREESHRTAWEN